MIDAQDKKLREVNNNLKEMLGTDDISDDEMELLIYIDSDNEEEKVNKDHLEQKSLDIAKTDNLSSKIDKKNDTIEISKTPIPSTSKIVENSDEFNKTTDKTPKPPVVSSLISTTDLVIATETAPCETSLSDVNIQKILDRKVCEIKETKDEKCDKQGKIDAKKDENCDKQCESLKTKTINDVPAMPVEIDTDKLAVGCDEKKDVDSVKISNEKACQPEQIDDKGSTRVLESSEVEVNCNVKKEKQGNSVFNKENIDNIIIIDDDSSNKDKVKTIEQKTDSEAIEAVDKALVVEVDIMKKAISESKNNPILDISCISQCNDIDPPSNTKSGSECINLEEKIKLNDNMLVEEIQNDGNIVECIVENSKNEDTNKNSDRCILDTIKDRGSSSNINNIDSDKADRSVNSKIIEQVDEIIGCENAKIIDINEKPDELIIVNETDNSSSNVFENAYTSVKANAIKNQSVIDKETTTNENTLDNTDSNKSQSNSNLNKILGNDIIDIDEILDSVNEIDKEILIQHEIIDANQSKVTESNNEVSTDQMSPVVTEQLPPETIAARNSHNHIRSIDDAEDDVVIIDITESGELNSEENSEDKSADEILEQPRTKRACNVDLRECNNNNNTNANLVSDGNTSDVISTDADVHPDDIGKRIMNKRRLSCIEKDENTESNNENLKKTKMDDEKKDNESTPKVKTFKNIIKKLASVLKDEITITEEPLKLDPGPKTVTEPSKFSVDFLRAFNKPLKSMTRKDLEQLVQQKIIEILLCNSELAEVRRKVIEQEQLLHIFRMRCNELQKQFCDLEMIHTRIVKDLETRNKYYVAPVKITRTVSVQVNNSAFEQQHIDDTVMLPNKDDNKTPIIPNAYRPQLQAPTKIAPTFLTQPKLNRLSVDNNKTPTTTPQATNNKKSESKTITNHKHSLPASIVTRSSSEHLRASKTKQATPPATNVTAITLPPLAKIPDEVAAANTRQRVPPIILKKIQCTTVSDNKSSKTSTSLTNQSAKEMSRSFIDLTDEEDVSPINRPTFSIVQHPQQMQKICAVINGKPQTLVTFSNSNNKGKIAYLLNNTTTSTGTINGITTTSAGSNSLAALQSLNGKKFVSIAPKPTPSTVKGFTHTNGNVYPTNVTEHEPHRIAVKPLNTLCNTHPAPLPNPHAANDLSAWKKIPPKPEINITLENQGVVIKWTMDDWSESEHAAIARYQLYAYQEKGPPSPELWRRVGEVKSMKLPMAVTLTQFEDGQMYYFAIRAIDIYERSGWFSAPRPYL